MKDFKPASVPGISTAREAGAIGHPADSPLKCLMIKEDYCSTWLSCFVANAPQATRSSLSGSTLVSSLAVATYRLNSN